MKGFAIDMDGTIYHGDRVIPGAIDFIEWLKSNNVPFRFLTNNSSHSRNFYFERLTKMGFEISIENILTSTIATARFILKNYPDKKVYPLCSKEVEEEIEQYGIKIDRVNPDIVLLTYDKSIDYGKINDAFHLIRDGKIFIATHPDDLCPSIEGYDIDIGPFIRMFEDITKSKATVIGKPNKLMLEMAGLEMGIESKDVIMVGDRLYTDIRMAYDNDSPSIAVLSGEMTLEDIKKSDIAPSFILNSVAEIPNLDVLKYFK